MKSSLLLSNEEKKTSFSTATKSLLITLLVLLGNGTGISPLARAADSDDDEPGAEILTRGPVHEAFAGIVAYDPEPGVTVAKAPLELIEEIPPEERPEGNNIAWIPGYWAWDDERNDFLWVSGTWRALPPGREWMAGYWTQSTRGHQWISGYWADANEQETTYLPAPPATVETGPNVTAPASDYSWTPGCWLWSRGHYAWRPGYWTEGRADWDWVPAHYVWTPRGYIFVDGFWDYSVERRGILFAPVYFESRVYSRRGYHYSPRIVINLSVFSDHLFLRPSYHHYYFGDYYGSNYQQGGIYTSFSFQSGRRGYDPFYSRQRWVHRHDRAWEHRTAESYQYRRDHETARPPRTWSAQIKIDARSADSTRHRMEVAAPIEQIAQRQDGPVRFQSVDRQERKQLDQRTQDVQKSREQRRAVETKIETPVARPTGVAVEPARVPHARSPIVAKPAHQLGRGHTPPKVQQAPKPDPQFQPKTEAPRRPPEADRINPAPRERPIQPERPANHPALKPQEKSERNRKEPEPKARQNTERQNKPEAVKPPDEANRRAHEQANQARQKAEERTRAEAGQAQINSQRNARKLEQKALQENEHKARAEAAKKAAATQQAAREADLRARQEAERNAKILAVREREEAQRNADQADQQKRKKPVKPDRKESIEDEKKTPRPPKKTDRKEEKTKPRSSDDPDTR